MITDHERRPPQNLRRLQGAKDLLQKRFLGNGRIYTTE